MSPFDLQSDDLIEWCTQEAQLDDRRRFLVYPSQVAPQAFIKYGSRDLLPEAQNQQYAFQALKRFPHQDRIRIPEVYRVIDCGDTIYVVMEYVYGETFEDILSQKAATQEHYDQIIRAIDSFLHFEIPEDTPPGPIGKGKIRHPLFKDAYASKEYSSVTELEDHINDVANLAPQNDLNIDFSAERLCFCFSDLFEGNFIFSATDILYVVDFEHASILPESFMTYALNQPRLICEVIKDHFHLPQENLASMKVAGYYFLISSRNIGKFAERERSKTASKSEIGIAF